MIRLAMMCVSQSPALRQTMSQILSIMEGDNTIEAFENDPTIYQNELRAIEMRQQTRSIYSEEVGQDFVMLGAPLDAIKKSMRPPLLRVRFKKSRTEDGIKGLLGMCL